jgi:hypothetical protein
MANTRAGSIEAMKKALHALWDEYGSGEYDNPTADLIAGAASDLEDVIEMLTFKEDE